ncbi:AzlC family ABC transporter permease [Arsenicicoccus sp. oral taxon 190]|uniref:AzlC family ABC transporter permease n=1 Tax=Arsenicicoccus sp. oral taxon 190 TaxID=1658671 RepID=UPI000679F6E9|nr:AzlC family ABC transporter permease [Arsenicicoccus sp. oral taxon 190]AKT50460.1 branched-chain amino acid ABC transporter permease [Arsenicicoccus sp. oral taxon 190]
MPSLTPATRMGLSIAAATGLYGLSFGALGVGAGLDVWQTCLLSLLMFTGGSQFGFIGVVGAGGAPVTALSTAALLGIRNALYGIQMNALLRPSWPLRPLQAQVTIDESTATAVAQETPEEERRGFWTAGVGIYLLWNLFTLAGALLGDAIGDPKTYGLDGAAVAGFLGLLWPRLRRREGQAVAVVCALATVLVTPSLPSGIPIIVAAVVALLLALVRRPPRPGHPSPDPESAGGPA